MLHWCWNWMVGVHPTYMVFHLLFNPKGEDNNGEKEFEKIGSSSYGPSFQKSLTSLYIYLITQTKSPMRAWGVKSRMCPPYPQRDRKRRLNGAVCRNHRIKRVVRVGARTGTLKNPTKCLWRWEPDRWSNFFFSPPAHLCAVTYMTEISLIVTLNNHFNSTQTQPKTKCTMVFILKFTFQWYIHLL